ncbi:hypothetical protein PN498_05615 [Oscillatoria sp. CS-180]|uniref:hypothetical protein n=1 Tax=Oscillatoria sp. CS-180 TaxID=3021720 RepID=UPI002330D616|nr:hypothetical protein [Oscillatoria sp. CS-180]MDB9525456.1 hypothetical protein [Oscillatoria sp. CS-180]
MVELLLAITVLVAIGWWWKQRRKPLYQARTSSRRGRRFASSQAVPGHLMGRLDRLTKDRRVSERLIERVEFNHPERSKRWCIEKAIYDIQRDRRG